MDENCMIRSNVTFMAKAADLQRQWFVIDAASEILGRLASKAATILTGKNKPTYTPHVDTGDFVVVINAEKVNLSGQKTTKKYYHWYSGFQGGYHRRPFGKMMAAHPTRIIEHAVKGMLPKNRLGRKMFKKLKVYAGPTHPHVAQQPAALNSK